MVLTAKYPLSSCQGCGAGAQSILDGWSWSQKIQMVEPELVAVPRGAWVGHGFPVLCLISPTFKFV